MLWENLREEEFLGAINEAAGLCILPVGCLEKHGQHLPVGTDYFEAMEIVKAAAEITPAVIFPTSPWLGEVSCFHAFDHPEEKGYRGCIGIKQETLLNLLRELCDEIARNGFNKILIVNGHGGNSSMLKHFLRCQSYEKKKYSTFVTSAFAFSEIDPKRLIKTVTARKKEFSYLTEDDILTLESFAESGTGGGHADIRETSLIMNYDASLVAEDRYTAESGLSTGIHDELIRAGVEGVNFWLDSFPNSYEAYPPFGASATIGRAMKEVCVERLVKIIRLLKK
jgi:creatinine amidohydrolase